MDPNTIGILAILNEFIDAVIRLVLMAFDALAAFDLQAFLSGFLGG